LKGRPYDCMAWWIAHMPLIQLVWIVVMDLRIDSDLNHLECTLSSIFWFNYQLFDGLVDLLRTFGTVKQVVSTN